MESVQPNVTGKKADSATTRMRLAGEPGERIQLLPPDVALAYRVNDAVRISGLSRSSIYKLLAEGKLRSVVVAGRRLIPADALRDLLRSAA